MVIAKVIAIRTPPTYDIVRRKLPQNDTERERERERARERRGNKEKERASWMPNDMVTAGKRAP